ncbi:hypothetical protein SK36_01630 [Citrobacter sp. MGH106]|nr:hypothetical protein SK36_01630 [Citrobacter sp. MGH106]
MTALNKQALLIENGQLVADTLRHLADNEIDSDYFAITSTNENGTEIDHELVITDYALQAAGTVDELVRALEAAEKRIAEHNFENRLLANADRDIKALRQRIAELEARTVCLPKLPVLGSNAEWYEGFAAGASGMRNECADAIRAAGIGVKGE